MLKLEGMCTLWRCKSTPTAKAKSPLMEPQYGPTAGAQSLTEIPCRIFILWGGEFFRGIIFRHPRLGIISDFQTATAQCSCAQHLKFIASSVPQTWRGYQDFEMMTRWPWPLISKISRLWQTVEDYYCAKFQVIQITGFRFIIRGEFFMGNYIL